MTAKHPPNKSCDCDACFVADLNAVLRRFAEQREARQHNAAAVKLAADKSAWRDVEPVELRRFLEPREIGKPPVDPDAEQLARDVLECARAG